MSDKEQHLRVIMDGYEFEVYAFKDFVLKAGQVLRVTRIDEEDGTISMKLTVDTHDIHRMN